MAVPQRRHSKARKNMRRSIWKQRTTPGLVECPKCHELKMPHKVCPECGYYKNREIVEVAR